MPRGRIGRRGRRERRRERASRRGHRKEALARGASGGVRMKWRTATPGCRAPPFRVRKLCIHLIWAVRCLVLSINDVVCSESTVFRSGYNCIFVPRRTGGESQSNNQMPHTNQTIKRKSHEYHFVPSHSFSESKKSKSRVNRKTLGGGGAVVWPWCMVDLVGNKNAPM